MSESPVNSTNQEAAGNDGSFRFNLAKWIIAFVFSVTGILGITGLFLGVRANGAGFSAVKDIFGILLPVLSAWAGTVLAFYFSRENFEAAARNTSALVRQLTAEEKLKSTPALSVMIPIEQAVKLNLTVPETSIKLKADILDAILDKEKKERLPILDAAGIVKYMAHRSLIDRFIVQAAANGKEIANLTLADMMADGYFKEVLEGSFRALRDTANLAEAKAMIDNIKTCSDVFITQDGTVNTKAIGWITNVMITQQATV